MTITTIAKPELRDKIEGRALKIITKLQDAGFEAYVVGGCVRDLLLGYHPKDFDITTNATPEEIKGLFRNCRLIGRRFRLAHIFYGRDYIEVATFRGDHDSENIGSTGMIVRDNEFGSREEDAKRRDFTINALFYDPIAGNIIDSMNGLEDLKKETLKVIGDPEKRYREDPVRMLRAIRFAAKFGFKIDPASEKPIVELNHLLQHVSVSRLFEEVTKLFHSGHALQTFRLLRQYQLFSYLFPLTNDYLDAQPESKANAFIEQTCINTDTRISSGKSVTPAFIYSVMLWHPMLAQAQAYQEQGSKPLAALDQAMQTAIREQRSATALPKRIVNMMRDVWFLQYRLPRREGKRAFRVMAHPRFRAGYDFLVLRSKIGEVETELATWWTDFQEVEENQQQAMLIAHRNRDRGHIPTFKRPKRRFSKPSQPREQ